MYNCRSLRGFVRPYVPWFEIASGCPICVCGRGSHQRARDLAFLPAHLLYRAIHKCILSFFPSVSLSLVPTLGRRLSFSHRIVSPARQRMHRARVSSSLRPPLFLSSSLFFFHAPCLSSFLPLPFLSLSLSPHPTLSLSPSPSVLRSVSSHRISTSSFKECREARVRDGTVRAGPRNYIFMCVYVLSLYIQATDASRDIRLCSRGCGRALACTHTRTCSRHGPEK